MSAGGGGVGANRFGGRTEVGAGSRRNGLVTVTQVAKEPQAKRAASGRNR